MIPGLLLASAIASPQSFAALSLNSALARAVATSPDVAEARDRVAESAASLAAARGVAAPAFVASYALAPQAGAVGGTVLQRLTTLGGQISLGDYVTSAPAVRRAQFELNAANFALLDAQRAERVRAANLYFDALAAAAELGLREQTLAGSKSDLRAAELRYRAGDAPRLDIVRAQVALARANADLDAARVASLNAKQSLAVETGESPETFERLEPTASVAPPPADPQAAVERALVQRSDLLSAKQNVGAEIAAVRLVERGVLPAVTVSAGYTSGVDTGIHVDGPSANVSLTLPISHSAADRVTAERARLAQAQDAERGVTRRIVLEVSAAARTYDETASAARAANAARVSAQQELVATQAGYRSGASSSLDVADARRTFVQAALDEISAVYAQSRAAAALEQEVGP